MFHALDVHTSRRSPGRTIAGLIPLIVPGPPASLVDGLVSELTSPRFGLPAPSYDRSAPDFDRLRYWRGPTWINMNWLLWRGLQAHGHTGSAGTLRTALIDLVDRSGCYEYFDPVTGDGIGAGDFSWTAALTIDLLQQATSVLR